MKYHFKIHKEKNLYWAEGVEIHWANAQAKTLEELGRNMEEVLELCLEEPESSDLILPLPDPKVKGNNIITVRVKPNVALASLLRRQRLLAKMSQRSVAQKLGIKHISQYQRLESGKMNPELETLQKLKRTFPKLSIDSVFA